MMQREIPPRLRRLAVVAGLFALLPPLMIASARGGLSTKPRLHPIPDMDNQGKFKAQSANPLFADGRAMRPQVPGTVARGQLMLDDHFYRGLVNSRWATTFPVPVTLALLRRGKERFEIYCAPCHGLAGYGDGPVAKRAELLQLQGQATWTPPSNLHQGDPATRPLGHYFNTITNGIRNMPAYGDQIPPGDRWAIVAYIKALQRSQNATLADVADPQIRAELEERRGK